MASHSSGGFECTDIEEMAFEPKELSDFMKTAQLPLCVCIVRGKHLTSSVQISKGDIVFLKCCETKTVTLTHQDSSSTGTRKQINVPLDFPYKFNVLPPKNVSDRTASIIMYPSIADLLMDSPTYFEATTNYDDPYLPGFSIHRGDRFKFRGLVTDPKDGRERLKVVDELENVLFLSLDSRANFYPLEDEDSYTLRQLIDFAPVPRRLKLSKSDSNSTASFKSNSGDSGFRECFLANEDEKDSSGSLLYDKDELQLVNFDGVIHMLKPSLLISASPVNDTETVWKIPLTADLCVREHNLDDYEIPSVVRSQHPPPTITTQPPPPQTPQTPTFPAPPTPPLPQPLVPVNIFNFTDIYGCPVKAKIMNVTQCDILLQNLLKGTEEILVHRLLKSKCLYAEDVKTGKVYCLSQHLRISFIEYPEKFSEVSELLSLPVGSEITVLEDIATDFPRPISLQFGDLLRITTNTASSIRPKNTNVDCKVLKCEKVNREGGSNVKMKLPLDFEVKMVLSIDPNNRRVIGMDDLIAGVENMPDQEVATLIDCSEKLLQDLPVNLKLLKFLPERMLVVSPFDKHQLPSSTSQPEIENGDWPSPTRHSSSDKSIGVSLTSGLVLAFRERLDVYDVNVIRSQSDTVKVPYEVLTQSQFEERERECKVWVDEEESEVQSVASDERSSIIESSSQETESSRQSGKRPKQKKMDKIRRLSQVLNPKHWRPPRTVPEPLPHPESMGLMALSMRPPSDQSNDYEMKEDGEEEEAHPTKAPSLAPHSSISSEEDIYEDMEIGPLRPSPGTPPLERAEAKGFAGRFHKSMPLKQIISRTYAKNRAKRKGKSQSKPSASSPIRERFETSMSLEDCEIENEGDDDTFYDALHLSKEDEVKQAASESPKQRYIVPRKRAPTPTSSEDSSNNSPLLPPLPPRRSASSLGQRSNDTVSKHKSMDSLLDQNKPDRPSDRKSSTLTPTSDLSKSSSTIVPKSDLNKSCSTVVVAPERKKSSNSDLNNSSSSSLSSASDLNRSSSNIAPKSDHNKSSTLAPTSDLNKSSSTPRPQDRNKSSTLKPTSNLNQSSSTVSQTSHLNKSFSTLATSSDGNTTTTPNSDPSNKECLSKVKSSLEPPVPPRRKRIVKSFHSNGDAETANSNNSVTDSKLISQSSSQSEQNLLIEEKKPVSSSSSNGASGNSKSEKEDIVTYSKVDLRSKMTQPQKMPVPKPRGLKKLKSPEIPPKLNAEGKSESLDETKRENQTSQGGVDCNDKAREAVEVVTASHTSTTSQLNKGAEASSGGDQPVVMRKDSVKPKPPPKPKPKIVQSSH